MFIAPDGLTTHGADRRGGTQVDSTHVVSFRPSDRRLRDGASGTINMSPVRGEAKHLNLQL
jgi:hypothetical protein